MSKRPSRDYPADFCPGLDCPVGMKPGPDPGNSRDQDPDIVPGEPPVPIDDAWLKRRLNHKTQPVKIRLQLENNFFLSNRNEPVLN